MNPLPSFKSYLQSKNYSDSTVKNYIVDVNKFLTDFHTLDSSSLSQFLSRHSTNPNYPRLLASLKLFCQFATDQQLVRSNPFKETQKLLHPQPRQDTNKLLEDYAAYLSAHKASSSTIKNYISDLKNYINWLKLES